MANTHVGKGAYLEKTILADNTIIGDNSRLGEGEEAQSKLSEKVYHFGLVTVGQTA